MQPVDVNSWKTNDARALLSRSRRAQSLFEGAMYIFVLQWPPALIGAIAGGAGAVPFGKVCRLCDDDRDNTSQRRRERSITTTTQARPVHCASYEWKHRSTLFLRSEEPHRILFSGACLCRKRPARVASSPRLSEPGRKRKRLLLSLPTTRPS